MVSLSVRSIIKSKDRGANGRPRIHRVHLFFYLSIFSIVPVFTYMIGSWLDGVFYLPKFPPFPTNLAVGLTVFFSGLAIGIKSTRLLYRFGQGLPWGELNHGAQSTRLVTDGLYAYTRNPMTFGYSLLPSGMGLMFQSLGMAFVIPAFVFIVMILWLRIWEEPNLERRFGDEYREYKRKTPFLIPDFKPVILNLVEMFLLGAQQSGDDKRLRWMNRLAVSYVSVSFLSLCLVPILTFSVISSVPILVSQKQLIVAIFSIICVLGMLAGISPSKCYRITHSKKPQSVEHHDDETTEPDDSNLKIRGHHPSCGTFESHVLEIGGRTFCSGCLGLVLGAITALAGSLMYFLVGLRIGETSVLIFWAGFVMVACGLLQYSLLIRRSVIHVLVNVMFVVGAFLLLVGGTELNGNLLLESFILVLVVFWIVTRIMLSQLEHEKICTDCGLKSCSLSFR